MFIIKRGCPKKKKKKKKMATGNKSSVDFNLYSCTIGVGVLSQQGIIRATEGAPG